MRKTYIVQIQGWGDDENEFYNMGSYDTREKAETALAALIADWVEQGGSEDEVVSQIDVLAVK